MKTFVYGDSFSNHEICKCPQDRMWYSRFVEGELIDRTRAGASTQEMFLLAATDALTHTGERFLFGAGVLYGRLPIYSDGVYTDEKIGAAHSLEECLPYVETQKFEPRFSVAMFHHTWVWATFYTQVAAMSALLQSRGHEWLLTHMSTPKDEHFNPQHPLIKNSHEHVNAMKNYVDHANSCQQVCMEWGIRPLDWQTYGRHGHHTMEGQQFFGKWIKRITDHRGIL